MLAGVWHLSGCKAEAELLHQGVHLLLLGNEAEQVAHDGLELLPWQAGFTGQAGQHVWQQVVDGAGALHHMHLSVVILYCVDKYPSKTFICCTGLMVQPHLAHVLA